MKRNLKEQPIQMYRSYLDFDSNKQTILKNTLMTSMRLLEMHVRLRSYFLGVITVLWVFFKPLSFGDTYYNIYG